MDIWVQYIIGIIIITFTNIYAWIKILNKNIELKLVKKLLLFLLMATITLFNYLYNSQFIRITTITFIMAIFIKILFNEKIKQSLLCSIVSQSLYMLAEIIFAFSLIIIFKVNPDDFVSLYFGKLITNSAISVIVFLLSQIKIIRKLYNFLSTITEKINQKLIVILLIILMIATNVFAGIVYYDFNYTYIMLFNIALTIICFIIIINSFYNKNKYIKTYDKYNTTLYNLKEYEKILDKYRIKNHENKNQLLTLKGLVSSNKEAESYIDNIINNKFQDDEKIMKEVSKIPQGGLRGLIYSKILAMKNLKIDYNLTVSKNLKITDLIKLEDKLLLDICQIIGVYLDNAIEAVKEIKEKYINIDMYSENENIIISVTNNYNNQIDIERMEQKGYTTKGEGHGYGLAITKDIISKNNKLSNEKRINKKMFSQLLIIKIN